MPSNHPETMGMEELKQETNTRAVRNPKYLETRNLLLTPQSERKINHISEMIKRHPEKGIHCMEKVCPQTFNTVKWERIGKKFAEEITSEITERRVNQSHGHTAFFNRTRQRAGNTAFHDRQ